MMPKIKVDDNKSVTPYVVKSTVRRGLCNVHFGMDSAAFPTVRMSRKSRPCLRGQRRKQRNSTSLQRKRRSAGSIHRRCHCIAQTRGHAYPHAFLRCPSSLARYVVVLRCLALNVRDRASPYAIVARHPSGRHRRALIRSVLFPCRQSPSSVLGRRRHSTHLHRPGVRP